MTDKKIRIILDSSGAKNNADDLNRSLKSTGKSADDATFALNKMAAIITAVIAAKQVLDYADAWTKLQNQLRRTVDTTEDLAAISGTLLGVANQARSSLESTVDLYTSLYLSTETLGVSQEQLIGVTKTINNLFLESGKSAAESAGAIRQLGQALQSGTLRGDEFNSVAEGAPGILKAIELQTGRTRAQLREMAEDGEITAELIVKSLESYSDEAQKAADITQTTLDQALTTSKNTFTALVGAIDSGAGASKSLAEAIQSVAEALGSPEFINGVKRYSEFFSESLSLGIERVKLDATGLFNIIKAGFTDQTVIGAVNEYTQGLTDLSKAYADAYTKVKTPFSVAPTATAPAAAKSTAATAEFNEKELNKALAAENKRLEIFQREIEGAKSVTDSLKIELDTRIKVSQFYREADLAHNKGILDEERALLNAREQEQIALIDQRRAEDAQRREEQLRQALESTTLEELQKLEIKNIYKEQELVANQVYEEQKNAIAEEGARTRQQIDEMEHAARLQSFANLGQAMLNLGQGQSRKVFEVGKALALAQATVALPSAVIQSYNNAGGYPWGLIPAAAMLATGLKNIQTIKNTKFGGATGGGATAGSGGGGGGASPGLPTTAGSQEQFQQKRVIDIRGIDKDSLITGQQLVDLLKTDDNVVVALNGAQQDARRRGVINA
jgi:tape measure domain-containing protein